MAFVVGYDRSWRAIVRAPLAEIDGMAWGVREDIERGKRGLIANWCTSPASERVHMWEARDDGDTTIADRIARLNAR